MPRVLAVPNAPTRDLGAVCLGIAATVLPGFLLGSLFVEMGPELGYSESMSGVLIASFFGVSAVLSAPFGRWVDRRGAAFTLRVALVLSAMVQAGIWGAGRTLWLIAGMAVVAGAANALMQVSANVWIAHNIGSNRQGLAFAVKQSSMPAAALVAGLALPTLAHEYGWRSAFGCGVALSLASLALLGSSADEQGPAPLTETVALADERVARSALRSLAVAAALSSGAAVTLGGFFVNSAVDSTMTKGTAGLALAVGSLISIASRLTAGAWADRRTGTLLGLVAAMLALGAVSYLCFAIGTPLAHLVGLPLAFGAGWAWPGVFNLSVLRARLTDPGRATGITQSGTYVGASCGPLLFGVIAQHVGLTAAWIVASGVGLGAALAVLNARRVLHRFSSHQARGRRTPAATAAVQT